MMVFLCDSIETTVPQIVLRHADGDDDWLVTLDCGNQLRLTTAELTRYSRFRLAALMRAERLFPHMSDAEWVALLAEAMRNSKH